MKNRVSMVPVLVTLAGNVFLASASAGVIEIRLGRTIERTWDQVQTAKHAYGPRQDYDPAGGETHICLPYGKNAQLYEEVRGVLADPGPGSPALFHSASGDENAVLTYKLHFDQRIGTLRLRAGWSELGLARNTVAGVEYSEDGAQWRTIREIKGSEQAGAAILEPLVGDFKATDLNTDTLYIRCYSRDPQNPNASGPGRWFKVRLSGDPGWGDAATTFFANQLQAWVAPVKPGTHPRTVTTAEVITARDRADAGARDDAGPWGIGSGAEWSGDYPRFNPMLEKAGVKWIRLFPEWQVLQPKPGQWRWDVPDRMVADIRTHHLHPLGVWCYFAPWASADGGTRRGPIKDMQFWRDYVRATVQRYQKEIRYWEIWNEFNGSFYEGQNKVKDYADLVVAAHDTARQVDPEVKVGMSVANFDVAFLDASLKAGAAGHFDFICVHPYENLGTVAEGAEVGFLSLAGNLRDMLKANRQPVDTPLWITELGQVAPIKPEPTRDAHQADMLAKGYLLSIAQGFQRIFWFEARGPSYGGGTDFGIIRPDWTPRPSYDALKTMITLLGSEPKYLGWVELGKGGYGFVFSGQGSPVLAAWSPPGKPCQTGFDAEVTVTDLAGKATVLPAGQALTLATAPVLITHLPAGLIEQARANLGKPYPWGGDYAHAQVVTCRLGAVNNESGLKQVNPNTTVVVNSFTESCRRTDFANPALHNEGHYVYFRVDPLFVPFGTKALEITIRAKRVAPDKPAGMNLMYESNQGYKGAQIWWTIPADDQWHEYTWRVTDASFVGQWGYNFRFDAISSPNEFLIREVRVSKTGLPDK